MNFSKKNEVVSKVIGKENDADSHYMAIFNRFKLSLKIKTETELAKILGIKQSSVAGARKRGKIPPGWITKISQEFGISSDWLLYGEGHMMRNDRVLNDLQKKIAGCLKDEDWAINNISRLKVLVDRQIDHMEKTEKFETEMAKALFDLVKLIDSWSSLLKNV